MPIVPFSRRAVWDPRERPAGCPYCGSPHAEVVTTIWRQGNTVIWRYRCCTMCRRRFRTEAAVVATA